jgi:regulator of protease activity HflC (stomatin/prohibitin superfamily)
MLVLGIVLLLLAILFFVLAAKNPGVSAVFAVLGVLAILGGVFSLRGLTPVVPGRAHVVQLFGQYRGTIRQSGLQWVNPFTNRIAVSTRIRNQESALVKVNDADGNPIEIAAVIVWQVADTAHAVYAVDDYARFVAVQSETAVRHIASRYPYDNRGAETLSLRDNAEEITSQLTSEVGDRVAPAGVHVVETRLTRLSYAPEIAQAMLRRLDPAVHDALARWAADELRSTNAQIEYLLRRALAYAPEIAQAMLRQQQASAVVGARQRIVEGAVGMVRLALQRLEDEGVVELDEERKAAMVSNLLVVLCSEQATQQVVNTGSLYQ